MAAELAKNKILSIPQCPLNRGQVLALCHRPAEEEEQEMSGKLAPRGPGRHSKHPAPKKIKRNGTSFWRKVLDLISKKS